jgi:NADH:ubiquinone oxidoreductase subunit 6 (subunit J)
MEFILKVTTLFGLLAAIGVVSVSNPIHSILCLILVFSLSGISLLTIGIEFLGLLYILVYVGAIAVLFLFVIMCLNLESRTLISKVNYLPLVAILSTLLAIIMSTVLVPYVNASPVTFIPYSLKSWDQLLTSVSDIEVIGQVLFYFYPLPVILIGFILLSAMIGAISLTTANNNQIRRQAFYTKDQVSYDHIIRELN